MMSSFWVIVACIGLALITLITRAFFMIPERELPLPDWLKRGLKYAPLAALAAVIAPEIVMSNGQLINSLADARLPALAASVVYAPVFESSKRVKAMPESGDRPRMQADFVFSNLCMGDFRSRFFAA